MKQSLSDIGNQQIDEKRKQNMIIDQLIYDLQKESTILRTEKEKNRREKEERVQNLQNELPLFEIKISNFVNMSKSKKNFKNQSKKLRKKYP
jgi:hypothetical protein